VRQSEIEMRVRGFDKYYDMRAWSDMIMTSKGVGEAVWPGRLNIAIPIETILRRNLADEMKYVLWRKTRQGNYERD